MASTQMWGKTKDGAHGGTVVMSALMSQDCPYPADALWQGWEPEAPVVSAHPQTSAGLHAVGEGQGGDGSSFPSHNLSWNRQQQSGLLTQCGFTPTSAHSPTAGPGLWAMAGGPPRVRAMCSEAAGVGQGSGQERQEGPGSGAPACSENWETRSDWTAQRAASLCCTHQAPYCHLGE